jgi:hypothetical protein
MKTYTIQELAERYGVGKQVVNARIKHLQIETELIANRTRVLEIDVLRLDGLDSFLKESKAHRYNDYIEPTGVEIMSNEVIELETFKPASTVSTTTNPVSQNSHVQLSLFEDYAIAIINKIKSTPTSPKAEVLASQRTLQEAVRENWIISTSQVKELTGTKPKGKVFVQASFTFTKVGKLRLETGWKVTKTVIEDD